MFHFIMTFKKLYKGFAFLVFKRVNISNMFKILFNPKKAKRHPIEMMFIGIFYSSLSILLSVHLFPEYSSLVMVFLTVLSCLYVVQGAIKLEESNERIYKSETWILKKHLRLLTFL